MFTKRDVDEGYLCCRLVSLIAEFSSLGLVLAGSWYGVWLDSDLVTGLFGLTG